MSRYTWLAKSIHGAAVAGLGVIGTALATAQEVTTGDVIGAISAALVAFGAVYFSGPTLPAVDENSDPVGRHEAP